ncbi:HemK family protein methyltransferase [Candidatus Kaiserbacteria bacterium]|nr:HemK family protein methyltransferase [Candidatus Kaiserbacteria bacterium]
MTPEATEVAWLLKEKYDGEKTEGFFADCARLQAGEPLAYLIGYIPFLTSTIYLDNHPLIPRTETEFWVNEVITELTTRNKESFRALDLCAGSGCIGVAFAQAFPKATMDFAERETRLHPTIQKNLTENHLTNSGAIYGGDLFEEVTGRYDIILSNPPYIDPALCRAEQCVLEYEPHEALFGGEAGTTVLGHIIQRTNPHLAHGGQLYLEHEPEQTAFVREYGMHFGFMVDTRPDQYGVERYTCLTRQDV